MPTLNIAGYPGNLRAFKVTIAAGASVSEMFDTQGQAIVHIIMPAAWTTAAIAYKSTWDGSPGSLQQVYDSGANAEKTLVAASHNIAIPQGDTVFAPYMQLFSVDPADGTTPVNQGAARDIILLMRPYLT